MHPCLLDSVSASAAVCHPFTPACNCVCLNQQHLRVQTYALQASAKLADEQGEEGSTEQEPVTKTE